MIILICTKIYGIVKAFLNATTQLLLYNRMFHNNILCGERKINLTRQITNKMRWRGGLEHDAGGLAILKIKLQRPYMCPLAPIALWEHFCSCCSCTSFGQWLIRLQLFFYNYHLYVFQKIIFLISFGKVFACRHGQVCKRSVLNILSQVGYGWKFAKIE